MILKFIDNFSGGENRNIKVLISILEFVWIVIKKKNEIYTKFIATKVSDNFFYYSSSFFDRVNFYFIDKLYLGVKDPTILCNK